MILTIDTSQPLSEEDLAVLRAISNGTAPVPTAKAEQPAAKKAAAKKPLEAVKEADEPEPEPDEGVTKEQAVERAMKLVSAGDAAKVKSALEVVGAKRVSELKSGDDVAKFIEALDTLG